MQLNLVKINTETIGSVTRQAYCCLPYATIFSSSTIPCILRPLWLLLEGNPTQREGVIPLVPLYGLPFVSCLSRTIIVVLTGYNKPAYSDSHQCSYHCSRHECSNDQHQQQEKYCFSYWDPTFHFILLFTVINFCYFTWFTPFGAVHIIFSNLSSTVPGCF